jgi:hypothetical protein
MFTEQFRCVVALPGELLFPSLVKFGGLCKSDRDRSRSESMQKHTKEVCFKIGAESSHCKCY